MCPEGQHPVRSVAGGRGVTAVQNRRRTGPASIHSRASAPPVRARRVVLANDEMVRAEQKRQVDEFFVRTKKKIQAIPVAIEN